MYITKDVHPSQRTGTFWGSASATLEPSQYPVHSHFSSAKQGSLLPKSPSE